MWIQTAKNLRFVAIRLVCSIFLWIATSVLSQAITPAQPGQFDPSDVYFQGYLEIRAGEQLEAKGDFVGAIEKFERAGKLIDAVLQYYPAWKPAMVSGRSSRNAETLAKIRPQADEQLRKNQNVVAELEGGTQKSGSLSYPLDHSIPIPPSTLEVDPLAIRRLAEAETEVKRLRALTQSNSAASKDASRNESRVHDLTLQRDSVQAQLATAESNVQSLRSQLAARPVEHEMQALNQRITGLEQEREAMKMALNQSNNAHREAQSHSAILETELKGIQQKCANLERDLKSERDIANAVVAGQRRQLEVLEHELSRKGEELTKANASINGLIKQLQESQDAYSQLRTERDSLLQEREQMSALLKLNDNSRIHELIQQNIGLAKNLREANDKVERLNLDNNHTKDEFTAAIRDLSLAKFQINKFHQEKREQDSRLTELENRLKNEASALAKGQVATDPAETAVLRDIIQRQLRIQERRRQARDLLIGAVKDLATQDPSIAEAINLFDSQEIQLSPDELHLLADKHVDGEFISPFAQDHATVDRNTAESNQDISVFERTAEKTFAAGQLLPTRVFYQTILELHPGHIPTLCKLGVVNLRLNDPTAAADSFRRAVELNADNPYAHRMLGFSLMNLGDLASAEKSANQAVELAPNDAKSQLLLATISYRLGRKGIAESHYKASISADPLLSAAYYNLALICSLDKRLEEASAYYQQALERGAPPDLALQQRLVQP